MTTYTFTNSTYYPTVRYTSGIDLAGLSVEVVIVNSSDTEIHRDTATVVREAEGEVAYDLDGVSILVPDTYEVTFETSDAQTFPSPPITLDVKEGSGGHQQGTGRVYDLEAAIVDRITANTLSGGTMNVDTVNTGTASVSGELDTDSLTTNGVTATTMAADTLDLTGTAALNEQLTIGSTSGGSMPGIRLDDDQGGNVGHVTFQMNTDENEEQSFGDVSLVYNRDFYESNWIKFPDSGPIQTSDLAPQGDLTATGTVSGDKVGRSVQVDPSNFITKINGATEPATFAFDPGTYTLTEELAPPKDSVLLCHGCTFEAAYDGPLLFVDQGVEVHGGEWTVPNDQTHTTDVIYLDTDRAGHYKTDTSGDHTVELHTTIKTDSLAANEASTGFGIHGDDGHVSLGCIFDLVISRLHRAIHLDVNEVDTSVAFIQGPRWDLDLWQSRIFIEQSAMCNANTLMNGSIQVHPDTQYIVKNNGSKNSITWSGMVWDTHVVNAPESQMFTGPNITVNSHTVGNLKDCFDGSDNQLLYGKDSFGYHIFDGGTDPGGLTLNGTVDTVDLVTDTTTISQSHFVDAGAIQQFGDESDNHTKERLLTSNSGSSGQWVHAAQIQTQADPSSGSEASMITGTITSFPRVGNATIRSSYIDFHFGTRNIDTNGLKPVWFSRGNTDDDTQTIAARVYEDIDGYHHLYLKRPPYNNAVHVEYLLNQCVEHWDEGVDPTANADLTLVWDSQTDAAQTPRVGPDKVFTDAGGSINGDVDIDGNVSPTSINDIYTVAPGEDIQTAIDTVAAAGGGTVQLAPAMYTQTITIPSKVTVKGAGVSDTNIGDGGTTIQRPSGDSGPVITVEQDGGASPVVGAGVELLNVDGNKGAGGTGTNSHGILIEDGTRCRFKDLAIHSCAQAGIRSKSGIVQWFRDCSVRGNDSDGIFLSSTSDFVVDGGDIGSNGRHGLLLTGGNGYAGGGTNIFLNGGDGLRATGTNFRLSDIRSNDNSSAGVHLLNGANECSLSNIQSVNNATTGILIEDTTRTSITGSLAKGNDVGVEETGTSDYTKLSASQVFSNTTTQVSLTGANSTQG